MRPNVIYFCNKKIGEIEKKVTGNWARLNPEYEIRLYDDEKCKEFLLSHYGKLYSEIFEYIEEGPIKADFWRVCILYANGGIYSDIDNEPLVPVDEWINEKADFVICSSYICFNYNPNFIVSERNNTILKRCIDWYVNKYERKDA
jgi:mannosyltransferase OCH1-like enzyme